MLLVLRVATAPGRVLDPRTLLLAGVIVGAFGNAGDPALPHLRRCGILPVGVFWMMGSLAGSTWSYAALLGIPLAIAATLLFGMARSLNLIAVGEATAAALGVRVERVKYLCFGFAALLAALAVAVSGVIGFVGLVSRTPSGCCGAAITAC